MFPREIARAIGAQTILALRSIHGSNVIHSGIVNPIMYWVFALYREYTSCPI